MSTVNAMLNATQVQQVRPATTKSEYRVSTQALEIVDNVLKLVAGCAAYSVNPTEMVKGALAGAVVRLVMGEDPPGTDEEKTRAHRTAFLCATLFSTAFIFTPGPHNVVPFVLGFVASSDGAFGLLRKFVG